MENQEYREDNLSNGRVPEDSDQSKNILIGVLLFLLILSFLGITFIQTLGNIIGPYITGFLSLLGYTTGSVIDDTASVVGDTAKTGIDITQGAVQNIGEIFKMASEEHVPERAKRELDHVLNISPLSSKTPSPSESENPIQKPISSNKNNWCLVGEYQQKRGCIEIKDQDKCLSGQVFPTQKMCLNPTLSQNA